MAANRILWALSTKLAAPEPSVEPALRSDCQDKVSAPPCLSSTDSSESSGADSQSLNPRPGPLEGPEVLPALCFGSPGARAGNLPPFVRPGVGSGAADCREDSPGLEASAPVFWAGNDRPRAEAAALPSHGAEA